MVDGYGLVATPPSVDEYVRLREESGLTPRTAEQARLALAGTWAGCHLVRDDTGHVVAMGRIIGDGGWYFHVADMAVSPAHQRLGLGSLVLGWLLDRVREDAPAGAYVSLMADRAGRALYARHGFVENPDLSVGMARWL
jgi:GNAT superfamily N-acetyltransferase